MTPEQMYLVQSSWVKIMLNATQATTLFYK